MTDDDELELSAAFDEFLRSSSPSTSSSSSSSEVASFDHLVTCAPKAGVIRLLHEVFRSSGTVVEERPHNVPEKIGRFAVQRLLGRGAFGCVYLAHDPVLQRLVALKIIHPHLLSDQAIRRRVLREREVMAKLQHPNIVPVWEAGEELDWLYIVSEYCPGPTLAQWLADRKVNSVESAPSAKLKEMAVRQSADWICRLADAAHHSHERGVVHRDLKPGNVLLEPRSVSPTDRVQKDWSPRLTDFGLAKYFRTVQDETRTGLFVGSLEYASPEQVRGQTETVGPASDIYSLGVILYELLTDSSPHVADSDYDLARKICDQDVTFTVEQRRQLPRDLQAITLRALQRAPGDRYASAAELRDDLQRFLTSQFVAARPVPLLERCARWARLHPAVAALSSLCIVFAVLLVATLIVNGQRLRSALILAREQRKEASAQHQTAEEMRERAQASERDALEIGYRANMRLAYEAWEKNNWADARSLLDRAATQSPLRLGVEWRWLDQELDARYRRFPLLDEAARGLAYQPIGRAVITIAESGRLCWWDVATRTLLSELQVPAGSNALAVSPDEKFVALPYLLGKDSDSDASSLKLWNLETRVPSDIKAHLHPTTVESVEVSPDGKWLASGPRYKPTIVSNLVSGEAFAIATGRRNRQLAFSSDSDRLAVLMKETNIEIHHLASRKVVPLEVTENAVASHIWLPKRELLVANTRSIGRLNVFSTLTGKTVCSIAAGMVGETMAASADGKFVALCSGEGQLLLQEIPEFKQSSKSTAPPVLERDRAPLQVLSGFITDVTFLDKVQLLAADEDGNLIWMDGNGRAHDRLHDPKGFWRNAFWQEDDRLTTYSRSSPAVQHTLSTGETRPLQFPVYAPLEVIHACDGKITAGFMHSGALWLTDSKQKEKEKGKEKEKESVKNPRFHIQANRGNVSAPEGMVTYDADLACDGSLLFATGANNRLSAWKTSDGSLAWEKVLTDTGEVIALDPETRRLFLGGSFKTLHVYNADTGELIDELVGGNGTASLLVDTANRRLLSGHSDGTLRIRDLALKERPTIHRGHFSAVTAVSQTPGGRTIITGDARGTIRMWQADGQPYGMLYQSSLQQAKVRNFAWSLSKERLAAVISSEAGESEVVCWKSPRVMRTSLAGE